MQTQSTDHIELLVEDAEHAGRHGSGIRAPYATVKRRQASDPTGLC